MIARASTEGDTSQMNVNATIERCERSQRSNAKHQERTAAVRAEAVVERARSWRSMKFEEGSGFGRGE